MSKTIAISNQKGGVGKTTTAVNLASALARKGQRVLLIDFDSQANASNGLGLHQLPGSSSIYDALMEKSNIGEIIHHHRDPDIDILPASIALSTLNPGSIDEKQLSVVIEPIKKDYDFILIDCPPALGVLNANALSAADTVLIPVQCEYFALEGLTQLLLTIRMIQKTTNPELRIEGILLTMHDPRTRLSLEVSQEVRQTFGSLVYENPIPRNIKLSEAPSRSVSIFEYDDKSPGAKAYLEFCQELLRQNGIEYE